MDIYKVEQIENPNNTLTVKPGQFWKNDGGMWCVRLEHTAGLSVRRYLRKWQAEERADKAVERENKIMKNENAKYTPGPWQYRPNKYDDWGVVRSADGLPVVQACVGRWSADFDSHRTNGTDPGEANARLIAAAPELLAALERAEDLLHYVRLDGTVDPLESSQQTFGVSSMEVLADIRAAIAKAKGE